MRIYLETDSARRPKFDLSLSLGEYQLDIDLGTYQPRLLLSGLRLGDLQALQLCIDRAKRLTPESVVEDGVTWPAGKPALPRICEACTGAGRTVAAGGEYRRLRCESCQGRGYVGGEAPGLADEGVDLAACAGIQATEDEGEI